MQASPDDRVRVLFDLSILEQTPGIVSKSGVVRTAEEIAMELQTRPEIDLLFCGYRHWQSMLATPGYVRHHPRLSSPVLRGPAQPWLPTVMQNVGRVAWRIPRLRPWCHALEAARQDRLRHLTLPLSLDGIDVIHTPFYPIPQHIRARRRQENFATLTTVHDLIPLRLKGYDDPSNPHYQMVRSMVESFDDQDWIVCDSDYTRQDLLQECPRLDPQRVFVTPLAAADIFKPTQYPRDQLLRSLFGDAASSETVFFVSLCSLEPRKNIETVARAFDRLTQRTGVDVRLVLIGVNTNASANIFSTIASLPCSDRIHYVGSLSDDLLPAVYSAAVGFLYLSIYEGFGLPPLEAMQCGTPTITSNATSIPEVVGDAGLSVQPLDVEAVAHHMLQLLDNHELRNEISIAGLKRSQQFTWSETVRQTIQVYRTAAESLNRSLATP